MKGYSSAAGTKFPASAIGPAVIAAGPIFVTSLGLALLYLRLPAPIELSANDFLSFVLLLVPATIVGCLLSLIPICIVGGLLHWLGRGVATMRSPLAWVATGGMTGALLTAHVGIGVADAELGFALVMTSIACAALAWRSTYR